MESYIASKGWTYKFKNGEYCLDECPLNGCGSGHFYINQSKEIFYCHKCGERGHLLSLKKRLGDLPPISHISDYSKTKAPTKTIDLSIVEKCHKAILNNPAILSYLTDERGFTRETVQKFKLGFKDGWITIPHFKDGLCLNIKSRLIKPTGDKKYFREEGCPSILFNLDNAKNFQGSVILTEGEFDAIAFDQMGFPNVVAVTNGAGSFADEWVDDLESFTQIYLSFDLDEAGQQGVEKAADRLGRYRCLNVLLPLKDANDCLKAGYSNQEMADVLLKAKPFSVSIVKGPGAFFDEIKDLFTGESIEKGVMTGWDDFDELLGGLRPNELTVLTGETASGKTTWAANLGYRFSKDDHPVLIASFEMKPVNILKKMLQMESGRSMYDHTLDSLTPYFVHLSSLPLYFVDVYGEIGIPELKDAIYYARRRYGVELVILDHLHFFLRYSGDHERQAIDQALKDIKTWAMQLGIHVLLIVHPTKVETENRPIRLNDLKGSSGLKQIPDNVLSIWRPRGEDDSKKPQGEIILHVLKVRDDAGDEGKIILTFDKRSQSYSDSGPGEVTAPAEGERNLGPSSPRSRTLPRRDWVNGNDQ
jgi:twinkle protein